MNDYDDEPDDDDYWDDEPDRYVKEEPDCHECNDSGCGVCEPSRVRLFVWRVADVLRRLRPRRKRSVDIEPPF